MLVRQSKLIYIVCITFHFAELTLTHELIHAYDHCRAYMNWSNCVHHACSEIRAANLSGDCHMSVSFLSFSVPVRAFSPLSHAAQVARDRPRSFQREGAGYGLCASPGDPFCRHEPRLLRPGCAAASPAPRLPIRTARTVRTRPLQATGAAGKRGRPGVCRTQRAAAAVAAAGVAEEAVDRAFERCYRDTAPFDRVP